MTLTIVRATAVHLPWMRHSYAQLVAEQHRDYAVTYPEFDAARDLDEFTHTCFKHLEQNVNFAAWIVWDCDQQRGVGMCVASAELRSIGAPPRYAVVHWMFVEPRYRKTSAAARLLKEGLLPWMAAQQLPVAEFYGVPGDETWPRHGARPFLTRYALTYDHIERVLFRRRAKRGTGQLPAGHLRMVKG